MDIESFVTMVAFAKQKAVASIEFSTSNWNFEREQEVEDTMLDLLKPFAEGLEERNAFSSTPTARCGTTHEVDEEKSLVEKLPSVATDAVWDARAKDTNRNCVHSLTERPRLWGLQEDINNTNQV